MRNLGNITASPSGNHLTNIAGVSDIGKQMISMIKENETLGVMSCTEDLTGVFNPHHFVVGRVHYQ